MSAHRSLLGVKGTCSGNRGKTWFDVMPQLTPIKTSLRLSRADGRGTILNNRQSVPRAGVEGRGENSTAVASNAWIFVAESFLKLAAGGLVTGGAPMSPINRAVTHELEARVPFNIKSFGAIGDGKAVDTPAVNRARRRPALPEFRELGDVGSDLPRFITRH
jgi:hypothetical protein